MWVAVLLSLIAAIAAIVQIRQRPDILTQRRAQHAPHPLPSLLKENLCQVKEGD